MPHVGAHAPVVFATFWIAGQAVLVLTAPLRPDGIFGFRMFTEASTIEIRLTRDVAGVALPVPHGEWKAHDRSGRLHEFAWRDRVRDPILSTLDARVFASYGAEAQLARLSRALEDVADHVSEDAETRRLGAVVRVWKNGRDPVTVTLVSHPRAGS